MTRNEVNISLEGTSISTIQNSKFKMSKNATMALTKYIIEYARENVSRNGVSFPSDLITLTVKIKTIFGGCNINHGNCNHDTIIL